MEINTKVTKFSIRKNKNEKKLMSQVSFQTEDTNNVVILCIELCSLPQTCYRTLFWKNFQ